MGDPARKKDGRGGTRQVRGRKRHGCRADEVADVIEGHDYDHSTSHCIDGLDSALPGRVRFPQDRSRHCRAFHVDHWTSQELVLPFTAEGAGIKGSNHTCHVLSPLIEVTAVSRTQSSIKNNRFSYVTVVRVKRDKFILRNSATKALRLDHTVPADDVP